MPPPAAAGVPGVDIPVLDPLSIPLAQSSGYIEYKGKGMGVQTAVENKIKKDLTSIITWDNKGVLTERRKEN